MWLQVRYQNNFSRYHSCLQHILLWASRITNYYICNNHYYSHAPTSGDCWDCDGNVLPEDSITGVASVSLLSTEDSALLLLRICSACSDKFLMCLEILHILGEGDSSCLPTTTDGDFELPELGRNNVDRGILSSENLQLPYRVQFAEKETTR